MNNPHHTGNIWSASSLAAPPESIFAGTGLKLTVNEAGLTWTAGDFQASSTLSPVLVSHVGRSEGAPGLLRELAEPASRARIQDVSGLAGEVLHPDPALAATLASIVDASQATEAAARHNAWISEFVARDSNRYVGVGIIPSTGLDQALKALDEATRSGLKGVTLIHMPGGPGSSPAGDSLEFWKRAAEANMVVCLNAAFGGAAPDIAPRIEAGHAPAIGGLLARLAFAGVPDAAPELRLLTVNLDAGWIPHALQNADLNYMRAAASRTVSLPDPDALPSEYIRRMLWATFTDDRYSVVHRDYFGEHHLLWGTPMPSDDASWPNDEQQACRICEGVPEQVQARLLGENTARLFGLSGTKRFTAQEAGAFRLALVR